MKYYLTILFVSVLFSAGAQSRQQKIVMRSTRDLEKAIFEARDSMKLEKYFGNPMTFVGLDGHTHSRNDAIRHILKDPTKYGKAAMRDGYGVKSGNDSTTVKYLYRGTEINPNGTSKQITLNMVTLWLKVNKEWKLNRLEMQKIN